MEARFRAAARAIAPGLAIALPAAPWVVDASVRASYATLGRDQGIFQYVAWAVSGGAKLYRDVRDVNGPLVVMVHRAFFALGGENERVFRILDLVLVGASAAFAGACLPALDPSVETEREDRGPRALRAAAFALAAWAAVTAQYLAYGSWDTAQRESFFDAFVLVAIGLQLRAQASTRPRRQAIFLALAGAASLAPWLGKPTFALFTFAQIAALALDEIKEGRMRRIGLFAAGGAIGALVPLVFIALHGDLGAWARITFVDVPTMYRFIWPRTAQSTLMLYRDTSALAWIASVALIGLVIARRLPRRALPLALLPVLGLVSAVIQAKAFPYHFHPATLGSTFAFLVLAHHAWSVAERKKSAVLRAVAAAIGIAIGVRAARSAAAAPYPPAPPASLSDDERLAPYERVDFFPVALRRAAEDVARHTEPEDTVQMYGMDPYLLFLARRRSATPYLYAYDLDVDAALAGSWDEDGPHPTAVQRAAIRAMRDDHERDLLARLESAPPAAFVFVDRSPLIVGTDARADFEAHCPDASRWMLLRYRETASYDGIRVWLRSDIADRHAL
jgi:hypothetical protein